MYLEGLREESSFLEHLKMRRYLNSPLKSGLKAIYMCDLCLLTRAQRHYLDSKVLYIDSSLLM